MARPAKPIKLKKLQGTYESNKQPTDDPMEARPLRSIPKSPAYFDKRAKELWKTYCQELLDLELLDNLSLPLLQSYCYHVSLLEKAAKASKKDGYVITKTNKGGHEYQTKSEWVKIYNDAIDKVIKLSNQFGFDPASRQKISVPKTKKSETEDFFS